MARSAAEGLRVGGVEFTVLTAVFRLLYRHRPMGDTFGLPVPTDWGRMAAAAIGVAGAVAGGWLVYGPGWLPWWASLAVGFVAGGACERLAQRRGSTVAPPLPRET